MRPSHIVCIYGNGEPSLDFSLPSTIKNLKDTVQHGEDKKGLDGSRQFGEERKYLYYSKHLIIKILSFTDIVQHSFGKKVLVDPTKFVFYLHIEERCLPYCLWVLLFCCQGNKYKEGFIATQLQNMKVSKIFFLATVIPTAQMSGGITNIYSVDTQCGTQCTPVQHVHSVITHIDGNPVFSTAQAQDKPKYLFALFLKAMDQGVAKDTFAAEDKQLKQLKRAACLMALSVHSLVSSYTKPLHDLGVVPDAFLMFKIATSLILQIYFS